MTWMDLLHLLEQQPYMELNKEIRFYSATEDECIDYRLVEFTFPTEFGDFEGNMHWQEWMDGGLMMQVRIEPKTIMRRRNGSWVVEKVEKIQED